MNRHYCVVLKCSVAVIVMNEDRQECQGDSGSQRKRLSRARLLRIVCFVIITLLVLVFPIFNSYDRQTENTVAQHNANKSGTEVSLIWNDSVPIQSAQCWFPGLAIFNKGVKVAHTRLPRVGFRSWSRFLAVSQAAGDVSHKPGGRLPLLPPGLQLPPQPLRGLLSLSLLGEQRHDECEQFA